tara:strand:- start:28 stop:402 length:375 start_codon:yes stop_codon:yes gene_type:complete
MYLPLTGFDKTYEKKRGRKMEVGSVGPAASQAVTPPTQAEPAQEQKQEVSPQNKDTGAQDDVVEAPSEKFKSHNSKSSMSTEDFMSLRDTGSGGEQVLETVKDMMALKLLEKAIEAITEIASGG